MQTIGVVAGSFDPVTWGHGWLIEQGARLVDKLYVGVGVNVNKKYMFSEAERGEFLEDLLPRLNLNGTPVEIHFLKHDLLVHFAARHGCTHIIRGIRNAADFDYETQMALVNRRIVPDIQTVYMAPPAELSTVSSSTVKGLVGFQDWEVIVNSYVPLAVLEAFKRKVAERGEG
jgi:pantetheine-phosphate adenylyltransferase